MFYSFHGLIHTAILSLHASPCAPASVYNEGSLSECATKGERAGETCATRCCVDACRMAQRLLVVTAFLRRVCTRESWTRQVLRVLVERPLLCAGRGGRLACMFTSSRRCVFCASDRDGHDARCTFFTWLGQESRQTSMREDAGGNGSALLLAATLIVCSSDFGPSWCSIARFLKMPFDSLACAEPCDA